MNIQKSVAFLYTNNEILEMECKKKFLIANTQTHTPNLKKNLTKEVKDLHTKNYEIILSEVSQKDKYHMISLISGI